MVLHDINEWRDLSLSLEWDLKLMEGIFYQLSSEIYPNQLQKATTRKSFHDFLFTKAQVISNLENAKGFLKKRACLRMLHTHLACITFEAESTCVENFIRFRLEEKKINFKMIQEILTKKIYARLDKTQAFFEKIKQLKEKSKQKSIWCVRDLKNLYRKPSQYYQIHVKCTGTTIEMKKKWIHVFSKEFIEKIISENIKKHIQQVLDSQRLQKEQQELQNEKQQQQGKEQQACLDNSFYKSFPPHQTKQWTFTKKELKINRKKQLAIEAKKKRLRLQILSPSLQENQEQKPPYSAVASVAVDVHVAVAVSIEEKEEEEEEKEEKLRKATSFEQQKVHEQFLALIEANGDLQLAHKLLNQKILLSGFRRAIDQAYRLDTQDQWELVKIWRQIYRTHTYQAMQCAKLENQFSI